jgi:hypothetical protein
VADYPYERQIEYWTSRAIEDYFLDSGFEVLVFPVAQVLEREVPFDHLFFDQHTNKIFVFQYKRLYSNGEEYWHLDLRQHETLQRFRDWIYYCGTEVRHPREHRNALHLCQILAVDLPYRSRLLADRRQDNEKVWYWRWGGFVNSLNACRVGKRIYTREDLAEALALVGRLQEMLVDFIFTDLTERRIAHLTPFLRDTSEVYKEEGLPE